MNRPAFPAGRPRLLRFLPRFLFSATEPAAYVVKAWLLVLVPTLALGAAVQPLAGESAPVPAAMAKPLFILLFVLVGPFLETLLMVPLLWLLKRFAGPVLAVPGSALLWAGAHSLAAPVWGLVVWWAFLVLSTAMLAWRERGVSTAVLLVTAIHGLHNMVAAAMAFAPGLG